MICVYSIINILLYYYLWTRIIYTLTGKKHS